MAELFADLPTLSQATSHCFTLFTRQILGINKFASTEKSMGLKHCIKKIKKEFKHNFPFSIPLPDDWTVLQHKSIDVLPGVRQSLP